MRSTTAAAATTAATHFYGDGAALRSLRLTLRAAQHLWPALAVRAAYRLFGTPWAPGGRRRSAWPEPRLWRHEPLAFERAGLGLYHWRACPLPDDAPAVLLVHGWGGHAGQMDALAQALPALGLRPVLLELPAHGRSRGRVSNLPQFARAIAYATSVLADRQGRALHAVLAHSLGANALAFAAAHGLDARRLVLLAPPASPLQFTRYFAGVFGLSERTRAAMQRCVESREAVLMAQLEPAATGPRIAQPTLVVHDRADRVNRFADGMAFSEAIAGAQLLATDGLGHRRILEDAQVIAAVAGFVAQGVRPSVSRPGTTAEGD